MTVLGTMARRFSTSSTRRRSSEATPPRAPPLHASAERRVRSVQEECLSPLSLCGAASLGHALHEDGAHDHHAHHHQGPGPVLLVPPSRAEERRLAPCTGENGSVAS